MPRTYIKKGCKNNWSNEQLLAAMKAVRSKQLNAATASKKFGIPPSTLSDHLSGKSSRRYGGAGTVLTTEEEKEVERACQVMQQLAFPLTKEFVSMALHDFLADTGRADKFRDGMPGYEWWSCFLKRHPNLVERKPEHLPRNRAQASNPKVTKTQIINNIIIMWQSQVEKEHYSTVCGLVISLECFIEITPDFLCPL